MSQRTGLRDGTEAPRGGPASHYRGDPDSLQEAIERARRHAGAALTEALCTLRALLDVVSLALMNSPASSAPALRDLALVLDQLAAALEGRGSGLTAAALQAVFDALNVEIARWERRSNEDESARAVLRAFWGLREALWELGIRPSSSRSSNETKPSGARDAGASVHATESVATPRRPQPNPKARVQRVPIRG